MEIIRSMHPGWLSNSWLVLGQSAVLIDSGGPVETIVQRLESDDVKLSHVICTHHHPDHIQHNEFYKNRFQALIACPEIEKETFDSYDLTFSGGEILNIGNFKIEILAVPGHTAGHLAILINDKHLFPGDALFRGSVGGTCGPGASGYEDHRRSIMDVLMKLPHPTQVHPGHMQSTTIGEEWEHNPFIRFWRSTPPEMEMRPCRVFDRSAVLLVDAIDYDGGRKCLVRYEQTNALEIVPGSKVLRI